jgi:hypothetical protein
VADRLLPAIRELSSARRACMMTANIRRQKGNVTMKNPLDSLGQTIILGLVLTVVVILLIHAIA